MQTLRNLVLIFTFLWVTIGLTTTSQAQFLGGGYGPWGGGYWNQAAFGVAGNLYSSSYIPVPPYHAIHPPVYYSGRVFRTYGDSPYAYGPERFRTTASYVAPAREAEPQPTLIYNPFFVQPAPAAVLPAPASEGAVEKSYSDKPAVNTLPAPTVDQQSGKALGNRYPWKIAPPLDIIQNPFVTGEWNRETQLATVPAPAGR